MTHFAEGDVGLAKICTVNFENGKSAVLVETLIWWIRKRQPKLELR